ncbi:MAG: serine protease, partial [Ilumatobacteraceae bacterium]
MRSITCASLIFCVWVGSFGVVSGVSEAETGRDDDLVSGLVVGGADTEITEVPWQAALLNSHLDEGDDAPGDQFCGATVISEEWLVTAAHCVDNGKQASEVEVAVGKTSLFNIASSDRHQLSEIVVSPSWDDSEGIGPDIALLRLAAPLVLDGVSVAAARLPTESLGASWPEIGHELTVSGWGCTAEVGVDEETSDACESSWPHHLQSVVIRDIAGPVGAAPCGDINSLAIAFTHEICAGIEAGGKDSCSGDSGGPLVSVENGEATLAGVVAWGFGCAQPGKPGIYTRVTSQRSWIDEVTGGITS